MNLPLELSRGSMRIGVAIVIHRFSEFIAVPINNPVIGMVVGRSFTKTTERIAV